MRGWTSVGLEAVAPDEKLWTVNEAAQLLGPPVITTEVLEWLGIEPVGTRCQDGPEKRGRRPRVYRAIDLIKAYDMRSHAA